MRNILPLSEAKEILSPYLDKIAHAVKDGFNDYQDMIRYDSFSKHRTLGINAKIKSGFINSLIAERVSESFKSVQGVTAKEYKGVFGLHFKNQLLLRFKKFNSHLSPSISKSNQTRKIESQLTVIPGFPRKPTFLYVGYTISKDYSGIDHIYISLRYKGQREWLLDITEPAIEATEQETIPFNSVQENTGGRVKIRTNAKKIRKAS